MHGIRRTASKNPPGFKFVLVGLLAISIDIDGESTWRALTGYREFEFIAATDHELIAISRAPRALEMRDAHNEAGDPRKGGMRARMAYVNAKRPKEKRERERDSKGGASWLHRSQLLQRQPRRPVARGQPPCLRPACLWLVVFSPRSSHGPTTTPQESQRQSQPWAPWPTQRSVTTRIQSRPMPRGRWDAEWRGPWDSHQT